LSRYGKGISGWSKHSTFGLRTEWLQLYLLHPTAWTKKNYLGNRQLESLNSWLKTAGLKDKQGRETHLTCIFNQMGVKELLPWEILWVNVVFNFATATWYVERLKLGEWTSTEMRDLLFHDCSHLATRTVRNAINELVSFLERTPVGKGINQGIVLPSRPRRVQRTGYASPSSEAIFFATNRLFEKEQRKQINFDEKVLWPWVVFGCEPKNVIHNFICKDGNNFTITDEGMAINS